MTDRMRALFFAVLALVVGELGLPGQGSTAATGEAPAPVVEPVRVHSEPLPASTGPRSWLPNRPADRLADAPFAPSQAMTHPLSPLGVQTVEPARATPSTDALLLLPRSRAPPTLS